MCINSWFVPRLLLPLNPHRRIEVLLVGLDVQDRCPVQGIEASHPDLIYFDREDLCYSDPDGIGPAGAPRGQHAALGD